MKAFIGLFLVLSFLLGGCGSPRASSERIFYVLETQRPPGETTPAGQGTLLVRPFVLAPQIDPQQLTYRTSPIRYERDFYRFFLINVAAQATEETKKWLRDAGLFAAVVEPQSMLFPELVLEGNLLQLYGDYRDQEAPRAVLEIHFFLLDARHSPPLLLGHHECRASVPVRGTAADDLMTAYNTAFEDILQQLESWLRSVAGHGSRVAGQKEE